MMRDPWLTFHPVFPPVALVLVFIILLATLLIWLEIKRKTKLLLPRIAAAILTIAALAGLSLRPAYKTTEVRSIALLTPGYSSSQIDSLRRVNPGLQLYHTPGANAYHDSKLLRSYHELSEWDYPIRFIAGQGLPAHALELLRDSPFTFLPSSWPAGIIRLKVRQPVLSDRTNTIEGVYNAAADGAKLLLSSSGGVSEDSVAFSGKGFHTFSLTFTPRQPGEFLYVLTLRENGNEQREVYPVIVTKEPSLNILFLQQYPSFEARYLKTFLGRHHRLVLRDQLSKNTYRYEYVNHPAQRVDRLTASSLADFDLLFIDTDVLQSLSTAELKTLRESVSSGLGLFILFNEPPQKVRNLSSVIHARFKSIAADTARFTVTGNRALVLPCWPEEISKDPDIIPILRNRNRYLAAYQHHGEGRVGFQWLQETYRLSLEGDSIGYSALWSSCIEQVARARRHAEEIQVQERFPIFADEPVHVSLLSQTITPTLEVERTPLPLSEDIFIDDLWHGKFWAGTPGWHWLRTAQDSVAYYVSEKNAWPSLVAASGLSETKLKSQGDPAKETSRETERPIPAWIFFALLLVSFGFLWLAPKV